MFLRLEVFLLIKHKEPPGGYLIHPDQVLQVPAAARFIICSTFEGLTPELWDVGVSHVLIPQPPRYVIYVTGGQSKGLVEIVGCFV